MGYTTATPFNVQAAHLPMAPPKNRLGADSLPRPGLGGGRDGWEGLPGTISCLHSQAELVRVLLLAEDEAKRKRETRGEGWEEPHLCWS